MTDVRSVKQKKQDLDFADIRKTTGQQAENGETCSGGRNFYCCGFIIAGAPVSIHSIFLGLSICMFGFAGLILPSAMTMGRQRFHTVVLAWSVNIHRT